MFNTVTGRRVFALFAYSMFALAAALFFLFLADLGPYKTINRGAGLAWWVNPLLVLVFCLHHSVLARPAVKKKLAAWVPQQAERSLYVLVASLLLLAIIVGWQPLPQMVWQVEGEMARLLLWSGYGVGWLIVLLSTFQIDHLGLFGLRQAFVLKTLEACGFQTPWMYRWVRHPMMFGFLVLLWATPSLSVGQLVLAAMLSGYIVLGSRLEEADLVQSFGNAYRKYQEQIPALIPMPWLRRFDSSTTRQAPIRGPASRNLE